MKKGSVLASAAPVLVAEVLGPIDRQGEGLRYGCI